VEGLGVTRATLEQFVRQGHGNGTHRYLQQLSEPDIMSY
jgi:hypothetical protein